MPHYIRKAHETGMPLMRALVLNYPDDPEALAKTIALARPLGESFGSCARKRAGKFSWEETIRLTEALYCEL